MIRASAARTLARGVGKLFLTLSFAEGLAAFEPGSDRAGANAGLFPRRRARLARRAALSVRASPSASSRRQTPPDPRSCRALLASHREW
jgi:hypothetical protein